MSESCQQLVKFIQAGQLSGSVAFDNWGHWQREILQQPSKESSEGSCWYHEGGLSAVQREALASVAGLESGMAAKQEAVSAADDAVKAHLLEVSTPSRHMGQSPRLMFFCLPACQVTAGTSLILNHLKMKCRPKYPQAHCLLSLSVIALSSSVPAW